jgi:hypothetical protein
MPLPMRPPIGPAGSGAAVRVLADAGGPYECDVGEGGGSSAPPTRGGRAALRAGDRPIRITLTSAGQTPCAWHPATGCRRAAWK